MHRNQLPFSSDPTITIITAVEFSVLADKLLLPPELKDSGLGVLASVVEQWIDPKALE